MIFTKRDMAKLPVYGEKEKGKKIEHLLSWDT
jgi:hypothetical protein